MMSKVSRPAAQLQELFAARRKGNKGRKSSKDLGSSNSNGDDDDAERLAKTQHFGVVTHFSESIRPPLRIERICLVSLVLFSANFTSVLASAFHCINKGPEKPLVSSLVFCGVLIGGVYLPMPISLWLTRTLARRFNHISGLVLFACSLFVAHLMIVCSQLVGDGKYRSHVLLISRLLQGLGCGVLFQARFILASLSTGDQHMSFWLVYLLFRGTREKL